MTPFYIARFIPHSCSLRQDWLEACAPRLDAASSLFDMAVYLPSPIAAFLDMHACKKTCYPLVTEGTAPPAGAVALSKLTETMQYMASVDIFTAMFIEGASLSLCNRHIFRAACFLEGQTRRGDTLTWLGC